VGFFLLLGYLGEELDDILATRELLKRAQPDDVGVSVAYPLPGTKFHELVKEQLGEKTNWQESSDLDMMFSGTYRSDFYRTVRDLLHEQVARGQSPALERRWHELVVREGEYRQQGDEIALRASLAVSAAP
jgi:anaerobic magnesium-protoporphyrin IX monomethyl ester cyclase